MLRPDFVWLGHLVSWKLIVVGAAGLGIAAAALVALGGINISADEPDGWVARNLLHFVFKRSVASRATSVIPPDDLGAPGRVRLGAQQFDMVCANCHGRPGFGQSVVALSLSPRPQNLPKVLDQFTASDLHVIVEHGVKYSAMPSWPTDGRGDEIWSMVAFLRQLPTMDAKTYGEMTAVPGSGKAMAAGDTALRPANPQRNAPPTDEFLYAAPASGFSDQAVHTDPLATCARCHGVDGSGAVTGGEVPNLTIQDAAYLRKSLDAYTSGARKSGFMQNMAAQLSGAQVAALADYFAGLPVKTVAAPAADPALAKRGETIAARGIPEQAIPACANCHESAGSAMVGAPHIAGQSAAFLRHQLGAMARGDRGSTVAWNPMPAVAHGLGDNDTAAVAAYYAGLKPVKSGDGGQAAPAIGGDTADLAKAKQTFTTVCLKCHVDDGRGDAGGLFPDLTLQSTPFVAQSLFSFRARTRPNDKMLEVVDALSFDDMKALAAYVNSLAPQKAMAAPDPAAASRGAALATRGAADRGVPACMSCHDAKGTTALPLIPRLQGQNAIYLNNRLENFVKSYDVTRSTLNPMPGIASQLTREERADLAAYFASLPPLEKPARP